MELIFGYLMLYAFPLVIGMILVRPKMLIVLLNLVIILGVIPGISLGLAFLVVGAAFGIDEGDFVLALLGLLVLFIALCSPIVLILKTKINPIEFDIQEWFCKKANINSENIDSEIAANSKVNENIERYKMLQEKRRNESQWWEIWK